MLTVPHIECGAKSQHTDPARPSFSCIGNVNNLQQSRFKNRPQLSAGAVFEFASSEDTAAAVALSLHVGYGCIDCEPFTEQEASVCFPLQTTAGLLPRSATQKATTQLSSGPCCTASSMMSLPTTSRHSSSQTPSSAA